MVLLSVNAGSSSLKVAVFNREAPDRPTFSVSIEGVGTADSVLLPDGLEHGPDAKRLTIQTAAEAAEAIKQWLSEERHIQPQDVEAIGYRVVHGGKKLQEATIITKDIQGYLKSLTPLAPNHMPSTLAAIDAFQSSYPKAAHVACFDTSLFARIPKVAQMLPISKKLQDDHDIKRYGFHGLSYASLLDDFRQHEGDMAANGRVIMAHLGSKLASPPLRMVDPSICRWALPCIGHRYVVRSGDIEPGVLSYLQKDLGISIDEIIRLVTYESGNFGVSGTTADMRILLKSQATDPNAALAIELFCYSVKKQIGSYAAVLGGVDSIILVEALASGQPRFAHAFARAYHS